MHDLLDVVHRTMRAAHIGVGAIGLVLFWIPILTTKGGKWHRACGKAFVACAYVVGGTGFVASVWALIDFESFISMPAGPRDETRFVLFAAQARFLFSLLAFLSLAIVAGTRFGVKVMRTRRDHAALRGPELIGLELASGLAGAALCAYGCYNVFLALTNQHVLGGQAAGMYSILIAIGAFGVWGVRADLKYIREPRPTPMAWWYKHMENMIGVGIGFHTAFLVFGAQRLFRLQLVGAWNLLPWMLPSVIGGVATAIWVKHYKRKFGELPGSNAAAGPATSPGAQ